MLRGVRALVVPSRAAGAPHIMSDAQRSEHSAVCGIFANTATPNRSQAKAALAPKIAVHASGFFPSNLNENDCDSSASRENSGRPRRLRLADFGAHHRMARVWRERVRRTILVRLACVRCRFNESFYIRVTVMQDMSASGQPLDSHLAVLSNIGSKRI